MDFNFDPLEIAENMGVEILAFTGSDALQLETLPLHHKDPFDRMIISQAWQTNSRCLVTIVNLAFMTANSYK